MMIQTEAIYEDGVLRPLTPLNLPEHGVVSLSISTGMPGAAQAEGAVQRSVLLAYLAKVESQPDDALRDGMSNRDHDRLIYGE